MCLYNARRIKLKEDLVCYKKLMRINTIIGPYKNKEELVSPMHFGFCWDIGKIMFPREEFDLFIDKNSKTTDKGNGYLHAFLNLPDAEEYSLGDMFNQGCVVGEMVIPKGTETWIGDFLGDGDSVAAKAMILRRVISPQNPLAYCD